MARDPAIELRLQRWAQYVTVGDGSGFPSMNVLHSEWQPPTPGLTPTMKVSSASDVAQTHRALASLSLRLRNTVVVHYCLCLPVAQQADQLQCGVSTVHSRIDAAHCQLAALLGDGEFRDKDRTG